MGVAAQCKDCRAEARKPGILKARQETADLLSCGEKKCSVCKVVKPLSAFNNRRASTDGKSYKCIDCFKAYKALWGAKNPDSFKRWYSSNKDKRAEYWQEWYEQNKDHRAESYREWAQANRHIVNSLIAKRNAAKMQATPSWADQDAIRAVYKEAARLTAETGVRHEVDHIYPLQGETVCGLHCEANLQILTKTANIRKKNRMPEDFGYV